MFPMMRNPRQSLFDALNVQRKDGLKISVDEFDNYLPYDILVKVDNETVATLNKGDDYTVTTGVFAIVPSSTTDDYIALWKLLDKDGLTVDSGALDGSSIETTEACAELVFYTSEYRSGEYPALNHFDIADIGIEGGIFTTLARQHPDVDFLQDETMDFDFLTAHSGQKAVSNAVRAYLIKYGIDVPNHQIRVLSQKGIDALARVIWSKFGDAWSKIYAALETEYKPLENYSMDEKTEPNLTDEFGVSDDYEKKLHRDVASKTTTTDQGSDTKTSVWGFNTTSTDGVPEGNIHTGGSVVTEADKLYNNSDDIETQKGKRIEKHTGDTKVHRSGNIGVTTSQQMLQSEIDLRIKNHMEDILFNDVDQILTTAGYAPILSEQIFII